MYGVLSKSHVPRAWSAKGGKFHLKLNIGLRPIANKYHEGKMKRTLERELKVPEIAEREANGTSVSWRDCYMSNGWSVASTQVLQWVLILTCALFLTSCVNVGSELRKTLGTW